jgi:hypothetical protein
MRSICVDDLDDKTKRDILVNGFREDHGPVVEVSCEGAPGAPSLEWLEKNNVVFIEPGEKPVWTSEMVSQACRAMREDDCNEAEDM